jgi:hypothetical protein
MLRPRPEVWLPFGSYVKLVLILPSLMLTTAGGNAEPASQMALADRVNCPLIARLKLSAAHVCPDRRHDRIPQSES